MAKTKTEAVQQPDAPTEQTAEPTSIHLRTTRGVNLVNPYTTQTITTAGVEVAKLDGWLDFQIESGKVEHFVPEAPAE